MANRSEGENVGPEWAAPIARTAAPELSSVPSDDTPPIIEPLSLSLMGKLFGVPLLIIGSIVGGAVVVVLLFAAPAAPKQQSVDDLLNMLESSSGEKSLGVLLPREKELWQAALELAKRLEKKESEVESEDMEALTRRLGTLIESDLATLTNLPTVGEDRQNQEAVRAKRLEFLIRAMGRTGRPEAVDSLKAVVASGKEPYTAAAMKELADLRGLPESKTAVDAILAVLRNPAASNDSRLVAATALSTLAGPQDSKVLEALNAARLAQEGELSWASALALARLGSAAGKSTLLDLLDRNFWESAPRYEVVDAGGTVRRYPLPAARVDSLLTASIDAASLLPDRDLWTAIERLKSDKSAAVRGAVVLAESRKVGGGAEAATPKE